MEYDDDRKAIDEMVTRLSAEDLEDLDKAEREHRWRTTPETLHVNGATGEMISPGGQIDDETIAGMERQHSASVAKYRARFGERAPEA